MSHNVDLVWQIVGTVAMNKDEIIFSGTYN